MLLGDRKVALKGRLRRWMPSEGKSSEEEVERTWFCVQAAEHTPACSGNCNALPAGGHLTSSFAAETEMPMFMIWNFFLSIM